ncbi:MAG TPA: threonine ammonia-lyase, partial [Candidatus Aquiluna sp.]|nr:threonine ammonia-lyase [Aquiluna sp.]
MAAVDPIGLEQFEEAQQTIIDVAVRTPLIQSDWLSEYTGSPVFFKCENLQRTGSFKLRGAYNIISKLSPEQRSRGV